MVLRRIRPPVVPVCEVLPPVLGDRWGLIPGLCGSKRSMLTSALGSWDVAEDEVCAMLKRMKKGNKAPDLDGIFGSFWPWRVICCVPRPNVSRGA